MPDGPPEPGPPRGAAAEAAAASAGMVLFALLAHRPMPLFLGSMAGLVVTAAALARGIRAELSPARLLGFSRFSWKVAAWLLAGAALGIGLGVLFRTVSEKGAWPAGLGPFVGVAVAIGAAEELLYRGYVQGRLRGLGWIGAVALAAAAHAAYKTALFALPAEGAAIDWMFLATWTFLGGLVFGAMRHLGGSVLAPLAAHAMFDLVVYGDSAAAPWWVWG